MYTPFPMSCEIECVSDFSGILISILNYIHPLDTFPDENSEPARFYVHNRAFIT